MFITDLWHKHGTKVIGYGSAVVGAITWLDHETVNEIGAFLGPTHGPSVVHGILVASGLVTAYRGHVNTRQATTPQAPQ